MKALTFSSPANSGIEKGVSSANPHSLILEAYVRGRDSFPEFVVDESSFVAFLAKSKDLNGVKEHAADLYLACACALGLSPALKRFEERYGQLLSSLASRCKGLGVSGDDFRQQLRIILFIGGRARPAIESYSGRGPLGGWLRVVAARATIELIERERRAVGSGADDWTAVADGLDVEEGAMRGELRGVFQRAVDLAVRALTSKDRTLLRQFYVHRTGVDGIAKLLGVHRSNASRAVAKARGTLLREMKRHVGTQLGLAEGSLSSAFALMRNDVALNMGLLLESSTL